MRTEFTMIASWTIDGITATATHFVSARSATVTYSEHYTDINNRQLST